MHTNTHTLEVAHAGTHPYIRQGLLTQQWGVTKHQKTLVYLQNILLYYRKSSGFEYTSFKEVHSAWRFGVLRLETQKGGRWWRVSLLWETGLLRCLQVSTSAPHRQGQHPQPQSLSCFFLDILIFLQKSGWKKVALKIQSILFILFIRQAKH